MSHTGALAGSDAAYNAIFRRAGLLRVKELGELFDAAEIVSQAPALAGERLAIVTNGGGAGVLAADTLADLGGRLAELSPATKAGARSRAAADLVEGQSRRHHRRRRPAALPRCARRRLRATRLRRRAGHELPDRARLERSGGRRRRRVPRAAKGGAQARKAAAHQLARRWRRRGEPQALCRRRHPHLRDARRAPCAASCSSCTTSARRTS